MAKTPILRLLQQFTRDLRQSGARGEPVGDYRARRAEGEQREQAQWLARHGLSRRQFLGGAAVVTAGALFPTNFACSGPGNPKAKAVVAIVGGGIAGLSCAMTLKDGGIESTVYEVSTEGVGGRMKSILSGSAPTAGCSTCHAPPSSPTPMTFDDGQSADIYGELIDTNHTTIHALAARFGIGMIDAIGAEPAGATETYYFDGGYYPIPELLSDFAALYPSLQADAEAAGYPTTFDTSTLAGRALDELTIFDWIESRVPGGNASRLGKLLTVSYIIEYGAQPTDVSSLELVYMLSGSAVDEFSVFGASDERWRVEGGNNRLPQAIARDLGLGERVLLGWELLALKQQSDGRYTLTFDTDAGTQEVKADYVVLALPFTKLRTLDIAQAGFDELKLHAINEQGGSRNYKLQAQFSRRLWNEPGPWGTSGGTSYSDRGYQLAWDPTRGQAGTSGIMVFYTGGDAAENQLLAHPFGNSGNPDVVADAQAFLAQAEPVFPGLSALWNGKVVATKAHIDRRFYSAYAYWRTGQAQVFGGYEAARQGNAFFCGEHTSVDFLGFMEGAASEGVRAGAEVLTALGVAVPPPL